jgi:NAD(P)-dependent dehydrogenase (short-subunit alcohol dehydrogenase family)
VTAAIAPGALAIVTGSASGIGLAAARAVAKRGMRVAPVDRPGEALGQAAHEIEGSTAYGVDVADSSAVSALAADLDPYEKCSSARNSTPTSA